MILKTLCTIFLFTFFYNIAIAITPVIFNHSESAMPGETIYLQGHAFGADPIIWFSQVKGDTKNLKPGIKLPVDSAGTSATYISVALPRNVQPGMYAIWIANEGQLSKPIFINKARVNSLEFNEIMPGSSFRIFGRNLSLNSEKTTVRFIPKGEGQTLTVKASRTTAFEIQLTAPGALVPGQAYQLSVSNGNGGQFGETWCNEPLSIRKAAADPFAFEVPWGADFDFSENVYNVKTDPRLKIRAIGDGIANDRMAIQEAIDQASVKGGVVYLPAGSYKLMYASGSGITMRSRVVLKGDGPAKTQITYGYGVPFSTERIKAPYGWTLGWPDSRAEGVGMVWPGGISISALLDLSFKNVNETGNFLHTIKDMPEGGSKLAFKNCNFELSSGWGLAMANVNQLLITGCTFNSVAMNVRNINAPTRTWPWDLKNSSYLIFSNNKHFYTAGRFGANGCHHAIFEHNTFLRDGDHQSKGETGGISLDYVSQVVVQGNTFEVSGAAVRRDNQGETILSQGGNAHQQNAGTVTNASPTSLTDVKKEFQDLTDRVSTDWQYAVHPTNYSLVIVSGTGAGQWRTITANNDTTLQVNQAWDVVPEPGSRYVITQWSGQQMLILNNILKDNNRGIWFYSGGSDVVISGNQLLNSEGIYIRCDQRLAINRYNLTWNMLITNNRLINTDGKRPAYVAIWLAKNKPEPLFGTGTIGVEIRNNLLQAYSPNVTSGALVKGEGYFNTGVENEPNEKGPATGILGTIFENNTTIGSDQPYRIGRIAEKTVLIIPSTLPKR